MMLKTSEATVIDYFVIKNTHTQSTQHQALKSPIYLSGTD